MKKLDKETESLLKEIANKLPRIELENTKVYRAYLGSSLLDLGHREVKDGQKVEPSKQYIAPEGSMHVNHYKRLKRAYEELGMQGVNKYIEGISKKLGKSDTNPY